MKCTNRECRIINKMILSLSVKTTDNIPKVKLRLSVKKTTKGPVNMFCCHKTRKGQQQMFKAQNKEHLCSPVLPNVPQTLEGYCCDFKEDCSRVLRTPALLHNVQERRKCLWVHCVFVDVLKVFKWSFWF